VAGLYQNITIIPSVYWT